MLTTTRPAPAARTAPAAPPVPAWWTEWTARLTSPVADAVAVALFTFAGLAAFFYVHAYGVNMIYDDQWTDIDLLERAHKGTLTLSYLWAQHNEHRMVFPKLLVLLLGATTHFNLLVEDYLCVAALCATAALVILTHRRRSPGLPLLVYTPVAFVLLSPVVTADALLGFNIAWFIGLLCFGSVLWLLDAPEVSRPAFGVAVAVTVVASYSCLQGLLIWPALLVLLWLRRRSLVALGVWTGAGVVTTGLYFVGFDFAQARAGSSAAPQTAYATLKFFVVEVGNVFGSQAGYGVDRFVGGAVLVLALCALAVGLRRGVGDGAPVGTALIVFGLAFLVSATIGRASLGLGDALRYAPFVLLLLVGSYLILLDWTVREIDPQPGGDDEPMPWAAPGARRWTPVVLLVAVFALCVFQAVESNRVGPSDSGGWHTEQLAIADVTANITRAPDYLVQAHLGGYSVRYMRNLAAYARQAHLSLFATSLGTDDEREGFAPDLETTLLAPANQDLLHGPVRLRAGVLVPGVTDVSFLVWGQGLQWVQVADGTRTPSGWVARWNTGDVGDGAYYLVSQVTTSAGYEYTSQRIEVTVDNRT